MDCSQPGGWQDAVRLAQGYRFQSVGTRRLGPRLSGLWAQDAHLRPSLSPFPYPGGPGGVALQAQPLPRAHLSWPLSDQEPGTRSHARLTQVGDRLGCPVLDRAAPVLAALVDSPDPSRAVGRLRHQAVGRLLGPVPPPLPSHARRTPTRPCGPAPALSSRRSAYSLDRWPATREGTRDPLRRARINAETRVVCRAVAVGDSR